MDEMRLRYPVAALMAYGVFLGLVRLWLWYVTGLRSERSVEFDFPELPDVPLPDFRGPDISAADFSFDLDELWAPVLLVVALIGLCGTGLYLVWTAPQLLAEIAVQGMMAAGMHEGLLRMRDGRWLWRTIKGTWLALAGVVVLAFMLGWSLQLYCPAAELLSQAMACPLPRW